MFVLPMILLVVGAHASGPEEKTTSALDPDSEHEIPRELTFGFKNELLALTDPENGGLRAPPEPGLVEIRNARPLCTDPDTWFQKHGFKCAVINEKNDPAVKEAMKLLTLYQGFDSLFELQQKPSQLLFGKPLFPDAPLRHNARAINLQLFARVWERPDAKTVLSYALNIKGRIVDCLAANFRSSKGSRAAEKDAGKQLKNIPIPKVHDDFWVFNQLTNIDNPPGTPPQYWQEYRERFSKFRENKDNMYNIWVPFDTVHWWDLAITSKGSCRKMVPDWTENMHLRPTNVNGEARGPGEWYYFPKMTGLFSDKSEAEAMLFRSSNFHSGVRPPQEDLDHHPKPHRRSVECRFLEDLALPAVTLEEAQEAAGRISAILGHSKDANAEAIQWRLSNREKMDPKMKKIQMKPFHALSKEDKMLLRQRKAQGNQELKSIYGRLAAFSAEDQLTKIKRAELDARRHAIAATEARLTADRTAFNEEVATGPAPHENAQDRSRAAATLDHRETCLVARKASYSRNADDLMELQRKLVAAREKREALERRC